MAHLAAVLFAGALFSTFVFAQAPKAGAKDPAKDDAPAVEQNQAPAAKKCACESCKHKSDAKDSAAKPDSSAAQPAAMGCCKK